MKIKLSLMLIAVSILIGCSEMSNNAQAELPVGFDAVSKTERSSNGSKNIYEIRHKATGCYFVYSSSNSSGDISTPTQIMVEKYGVSVPYCD